MKKIEILRDQVNRIRAVLTLAQPQAGQIVAAAVAAIEEHEARLDALTEQVNRLTDKRGDPNGR